ncbi:MAG TPA: class C beta-lactamase [Telluria sp.]
MNTWLKPIGHLAIATVCSGLLPLTSCAATDPAKLRAIVDTTIRPLMAEYDVPGMAVALTVDGKTIYFNYGVASREKGTPVSEKTLFELGSISKTFTATLASYAEVMGKLSLADHPSKYMPQLKDANIDAASLLELGTYTAGGLPLQFPDEVGKDQMVRYFQQWKPDAAPATQRRYSNPSIGLLGHLTALALKADFADAVENRLFPLLGLKHSHIRVPPRAMMNYAWGYDKENKPGRVSADVFAAEAYGVKSSAADMIRFVRANIEPERLQGPIRRAVDGTHVGFFQVGEMVQGLGWEQYRYPVTLDALLAGNSQTVIMEANAVSRITSPQVQSRGTLFNKSGSTRGFSAYVAFVPEQKIGIVILANKNYPIPARVTAAYAILSQLTGGQRSPAPPQR